MSIEFEKAQRKYRGQIVSTEMGLGKVIDIHEASANNGKSCVAMTVYIFSNGSEITFNHELKKL